MGNICLFPGQLLQHCTDPCETSVLTLYPLKEFRRRWELLLFHGKVQVTRVILLQCNSSSSCVCRAQAGSHLAREGRKDAANWMNQEAGPALSVCLMTKYRTKKGWWGVGGSRKNGAGTWLETVGTSMVQDWGAKGKSTELHYIPVMFCVFYNTVSSLTWWRLRKTHSCYCFCF